MLTRKLVILLFIGAFFVTGCTATDPQERGSDAPAILHVPAQYPTISDAVEAADEGDTVLVAAGVYRETVAIDTPGVTLRGEARNQVIIDGEVLRGNGIVVSAARVTVQNLTVRNATQNGVLVTGMRDDDGAPVGGHDGYRPLEAGDFPLLDGFRVDHVTASNNGLYGIYAFNAAHGVISDSYASGGADSGIYVGQCDQCDTVVSGNVAERNAVGFEIANAGGDLLVVGNRFSGNRVGVTVASDYQEAFVPQTAATIAGNVIAANAQPDTPEQAEGGYGIGIGIAGGTENVVRANLIAANPSAGLVLTSAEDIGPTGNRVTANVFGSNGVDVAYTPSARAPGQDNCWEDNTVGLTAPADLQTTSPCAAPAPVTAGAFASTPGPAGIPFPDVAPPPVQPDLGSVDEPLTPWGGTADVPPVDLAAITVPAATLLEENAAIRWE